MLIEPKKLHKHSRIAVTCPSFAMNKNEDNTFARVCSSKGMEVIWGQTTKPSDTLFAADAQVRLAEFQTFLDDPSIDAIVFGRGGYGWSQIIDNIDWKSFASNPKWLVGFSDVTLLHSTLYHLQHAYSLHAPMVVSFDDHKCEDFYLQKTFDLLLGEKLDFITNETLPIHEGECSGHLVGGNLSLMAHSVGTVSQLNVDNCILVLEDVGEYVYAIERMLFQLKRAGMFKKVRGIILGEFSNIKELNKPFGKNTYELFQSFFADLAIPICFHFPIGHEKRNLPFKHGKVHTLSVSTSQTQLVELD